MKKIILAFTLFSSLVTAQIIPADGFWRTTDDPEIGSGLLITTQGDTTLVSVFSYDEQGKNSWYIASGQVDQNGLFEADLYQTQNGSNIVASNPQSASAVNTGERIKIQFSGNQMGELTVGDSVNKSIQTFHFGLESWQTEHQTLPDGTFYTLPVLDGIWVLGSPGHSGSAVLDLQYDPILSGGRLTAPYQGKVYLSQHPSTYNWAVTCPWKVNSSTDPVLTPFCTVYSENFEEELFTINYAELGAEKMLLKGNPNLPTVNFEAFRVNSQSQVHSGHWRTHDDPAVGSGLYLITQGNITLALLYSYHQDGTPEWGIAAGSIDDNGVFQAELLMPTDGKPFYFGTPTAATLMEERKSLTLTFQGAEVGSISIDGSEPRTMQHYNYGVELFETEQLTFNEQAFKYPGQAGQWIAYDENLKRANALKLEAYCATCLADPPPPLWFNANAYITDENDFINEIYMNFICPKVLPIINSVPLEQAFCSGVIQQSGNYLPIKLYFEDIGANHFKLYVSETSTEVADIDRSYPVIHFYKVTDD
ncbi:MAG: hypothetical protein KDI92_06015 [Xanthomonadales bacterium]|nr:hypothetical protein [Xanthomonadales bacterium]